MASPAGLSIFKSLDLDESEEQVKATSAKVYGWHIYNAHATDTRFVKWYNATAANVTVGTTVPVATMAIKALTTVSFSSEHGIAFSTALTVAATTAVADNDTGGPAANDVQVNIFYQ